MKLIGNNGEVLAEWTATAGKRNLYCHGGFGLMLTRKALERCVRADDTETIDIFKVPDLSTEFVKAAAVPKREEEQKEQKSVFRLFGLEV